MPRLLLVAGAAVILIAMTGCVDPHPPVTPTPTPAATPVFASEEEALEAAEEAYREYLAVGDRIFAEGGAEPERLDSVATGRQLELDIAGFAEVARLGQHSIGSTTFRDSVVQRFDPTSSIGTVTLYLCEDVTDVDVVDSEGRSLVSPTRPNFVTYEVSFDLDQKGTTLLVSNKQAWEASC